LKENGFNFLRYVEKIKKSRDGQSLCVWSTPQTGDHEANHQEATDDNASRLDCLKRRDDDADSERCRLFEVLGLVDGDVMPGGAVEDGLFCCVTSSHFV
jgi:hypothetical protein